MPRSGRRTKQAIEVYSASFSSAFRFLIARSLNLNFFTSCATSMAFLGCVRKVFAGHTPSLKYMGGRHLLGTEAKLSEAFRIAPHRPHTV